MLKEEPKIIILLAAYNRQDLIAETLDSILSQSYCNWECLITDDRSTDKTAEIAKKYVQKESRFSYHLKPVSYPQGLSGTRNFGIDLAKERGAEFIQFFDDDDIMYPQKLELQVKPFKANPGLYFTVCKYDKLLQMQEGENKKIRPEFPISFQHLGDAILSNQFRMNSLGPLWNLKFLEKFRFDERLRYAEEWELYIRMGYLYPNPENYKIIDEYLFAYRKHPRTLTMGMDENLEKRKSSAISKFVIFENLMKNRLHTPVSIKYFTRVFAFQYHEKNLKRILTYIKKENFSLRTRYIVNMVLIFGKLYYKIVGKLTSFIQ